MSDTLRVSNLHFGNAASNYNQPQMGFTSVGIGSTTNYGFLQFFGTSNTLCWTANGTVGIGTTNPLVKLQLNETPINGDVTRKEMFRGVRDGTPTVQNSVSMAFALGASTIGINPYGCLDIKVNGFPGAPNIYGSIPDVTVMSVVGNGNVGIGSTNPTTALDVVGAISLSGTFTKNGTTSGYDTRISGGTATNSGYVDFFANGSSRGYIGNASTVDLDLVAQNGAKLNFYTAGTNRMTISTGGNVGIGTAAPSTTLHVNGTLGFAPNTITRLYSGQTPQYVAKWNYYASSIGNTIWNGTSWSSNTDGISYGCCAIVYGWNNIYFCANFTSGMSSSTLTDDQMGASTRMTILSSGNVGIGTTAPAAPLHLHGINASGLWDNSCLRITNGFNSGDVVANGTSIQLHNGLNAYFFNIMTYGFGSGTGSSIYITSDSSIGVTFARGSNAWSTYSDSRMKINKVPLSSELSNILKLNPVSYLYDTDPSENVAIVTRVGFLADEVFDIYPNLVTKDSGMPHTNQQGETFIPMTMCMTDLIPYHTKAIQELAYKNDTLEAKNAELTQKLDSLLAWAQTQGF